MTTLFPLYPIFLDLVGRSAVLLGGDDALAAMARDLAGCGASVRVYAPTPGIEMRALSGSVRIYRRRWRAADMRDAVLVVAAADEKRPKRARAAAKGAQAVFHMMEAPERSDIVLGAAFSRGSLAIGVTAPGLPNALEAAIRTEIAGALPEHLEQFLDAARAAGGEVAAMLSPRAESEFWRTLLRAAAGGASRDWGALIESALVERAPETREGDSGEH